MINLVTGLPGAGKTLWTLKTVVDYVEKENKALELQGQPLREVYYHGIPELTLAGWHMMESPEDWINLPSHSIIVIDECQSTFRPRAASVKPPPYISEFETHRHKGLDFFLLTQHPMLVDGNIRRLAGKHYHVVRFYGFQKSTIHEFQSVRDNVDKNQKNSISTHFVYPKEVYSWYKSADAHTMKKRIPMRMVMVILLPILLVVVGYFLYQSIVDIRTKPTEMSNNLLTNKPNSVDSTGQPVEQQRVKAPLTYVELHTPAVKDFPHTAPIYEKVTEPVRAPYPAACIYSKSHGCDCFSEQGTRMQVSLMVCINIVQNGYYVDWKIDDDKAKQSEHEQASSKQPEQSNQDQTHYVKTALYN